MSADTIRAIEMSGGIQPEQTEGTDENEEVLGLLASLCAAWEDVQRTRLAMAQRGLEDEAATLKPLEDRLGRQIRRQLEQHPIWPWLSQYPGLGGVHTARIVALIRDPHRFPGRQCTEGHHHSAVGDARETEPSPDCGVELTDGTICVAPVGPVRRGTGTRALWHYLGLHVVDGHSPRRRKGHKTDWNPKGKTAILMPGGIAEQIVRLRVPKYRELYDQTKDRMSLERAVAVLEPDGADGPLPIHSAEAEALVESDEKAGLRPFQIDAIARKVAAKAFVADLLAEWKRAVP